MIFLLRCFKNIPTWQLRGSPVVGVACLYRCSQGSVSSLERDPTSSYCTLWSRGRGSQLSMFLAGPGAPPAAEARNLTHPFTQLPDDQFTFLKIPGFHLLFFIFTVSHQDSCSSCPPPPHVYFCTLQSIPHSLARRYRLMLKTLQQLPILRIKTDILDQQGPV